MNTPSCDGKSRILSHKLAVKIARRMRKTHKGRLCVYRCPECGWWHVGTQK